MTTLTTSVSNLETVATDLAAAIVQLTTDFAAAGTAGDPIDTAKLATVTATLQQAVSTIVAVVEAKGVTLPPVTTEASIIAAPSVVPIAAIGLSLTITGIGTAFLVGASPFALAGAGGVGTEPPGAAIASQTVVSATDAIVVVNGPLASESVWSVKDTVSGAFAPLSSV